MSMDTTPEEDALLAFLKANYCGGRVYDFIPDDEELKFDDVGGVQTVKPYLTVTFGNLYPSGRDRGLGGEGEQPHVWPISVAAHGATASIVRAIVNPLRVDLVGKQLSDNVSELRASGGGSFRERDSAGRPTRAAQLISLECDANMAIA